VAARVAAEIAAEFRSQPELIKGAGGIFTVTADGALVYDKKATGRFPDEGEITGILRAKAKQSPPPRKASPG
jgi:selenoprotein W-related protein